MNTDDLHYIADQILAFVEKKSSEKVKAPPEVKDPNSPFSFGKHHAIGWDFCEFDSGYQKPSWLRFIYVTQDMSLSQTEDYYEYSFFEFRLLIKKGEDSGGIPLTVKWNPLDNVDTIRQKGRGAMRRDYFFTQHGRIDPHTKTMYVPENPDSSQLERGYKNLIIATPDSDLTELAMQVGIYLYREGILKDRMIMYPLFINILKNLSKSNRGHDIEKELEVFNSLIERYAIPNNATSFRSHFITLLPRLRESNQTLGSTVDYAGKYTNKEGEMDIKSDTQYIYGVLKDTLYTKIERGELNVPKRGDKYQWKEARKEIDKIKKELDKRKNWIKQSEYLAEKLMEARPTITTLKSAKATLRRWRNKGMSVEEIAQKIRNEL